MLSLGGASVPPWDPDHDALSLVPLVEPIRPMENGPSFPSYPDNKIEIGSVEISGDSVKITCAGDLPASGVTVGYAITSNGAPRPNGFATWGHLRDSDPFVGATTRAAQPNYAVSFEMPVP
ncbi:uncharacterized protein SOCEGT47_044850 [Sorangium cellulosum]|uniref:Uncharacterized protein n=1 Tax=Sorangium cellulosum TaxID=56 RepID=A0A4P2Q3P2_SORCE|nr:hypothetical protein [Sorangium cellulosum]AUX23954.1 uncharacterized protein SOCEGT47_044850 [Sorangium cellulosum]